STAAGGVTTAKCMEALRIQPGGFRHGSDCRLTARELDGESDGSSLFSGLAALAIAVVAFTLAVLPAAVALRVLALPSGGVLAALECLGAGLLGAKLIAFAWAVVGRLLDTHATGVAVATRD
ncbi:MAG: hypothetical protein ACYC9D_13215, partial [Candidatus Dormibacteria bacterium]